MRDRIGALDGRLTILASPGKGATIAGTVPLQTSGAGPVVAATGPTINTGERSPPHV